MWKANIRKANNNISNIAIFFPIGRGVQIKSASILGKKEIKMKNEKRKITEVNFLDIEKNEEYLQFIEYVLKQAFEEEGLDNTHIYINIILTNPNRIRQINEKYRNIDKETDVLSFPMFEKDEIENFKSSKSSIPEVLGDIIISIDRVKEQAREYGHSFERELAYMLIHGFYHLMGYDHMKEEEKKEMREKEENVLNLLNIKR